MIDACGRPDPAAATCCRHLLCLTLTVALCAFVAMGIPALAQPKSPPKPKATPQPNAPKRPRTLEELEGDVQKVRERFRGLMLQWENLRALELVPVPWLKPVDLQGNLRLQLGQQYRTLLKMRRATRQWDTYWAEEHKIADALLGLYRDVAPLAAELARAFDADLASMLSKASKAHRTFDEAISRENSLLRRIRRRLDELEAPQKQRQRKMAALITRLATLAAKEKAAKEVLALARKEDEPEAIKKALDTLQAAQFVLNSARSLLANLRVSYANAATPLGHARRFWLAATLSAETTDSAKIRLLAGRLAAAHKLVKTASQQLSIKLGDALALAEEFDELKPGAKAKAKLFRRLRGLLKRHLAALKLARSDLKKARVRWNEARNELQLGIDSRRDLRRRSSSALKRNTTAWNKARSQHAELLKQLAKAKQLSRPKLVERLGLQLAIAAREVTVMAQRVAASRKALNDAKQDLTLLSLYADVIEHRPRRVPDVKMNVMARQWTETVSLLAAAPDKAHKLTFGWLRKNRRYLSVLSIGERYRDRIKTLNDWKEFAELSRKNLTEALGAINLAVRTVDERLKRDIDAGPAVSKKPNGASRLVERSPYARHRAALLRLERRRIGVLLQGQLAVLNQKLLSDQLKAAETAAAVQGKDLALAKRELKFLTNVHEHAVQSVFEHRTWRNVWKSYLKRATARHKTLTSHHRETFKVVKLLQIEEQYYEYQIKLVAEELARVKTAITAEESKRWRAIVASVTDWLRKNTVDFLLMLFLAFVLYRLAGVLEHRIIARAHKRHVDNRATAQQIETLSRIAGGVVKLMVIGTATVWFLTRVGVNVVPVLGGAAVFGLAISFGSQNLVRDVVTGFFILLEKHYAVGDMIEISGISGTVETLTLRRTVIRSRDGKAHIFPNGAVSVVTNRTLGWSRVCVQIGVAYASDLAKVQAVCDATGQAMFDDPQWRSCLLVAPRFQGLTELADSALIVLVAGEIRPHTYFEVTFELNRRLKEAFDAAQIEIPFPQRDLHVRSGLNA